MYLNKYRTLFPRSSQSRKYNSHMKNILEPVDKCLQEWVFSELFEILIFASVCTEEILRIRRFPSRSDRRADYGPKSPEELKWNKDKHGEEIKKRFYKTDFATERITRDRNKRMRP